MTTLTQIEHCGVPAASTLAASLKAPSTSLSPSASAKLDVARRGRKPAYLRFVKRLKYDILKITILLILPLQLGFGAVQAQPNAPRKLTLSESAQLASKQDAQAPSANLHLMLWRCYQRAGQGGR